MESNGWRLEPGYLFRRMQQVAVAVFAEECADIDITCLQYAALARINERPGIDATRLAGLLDLDRSTVGGVIERLELKNHIKRTGTAGDKRIKVLTATRSGRALLARVEPRLGRINRRVLRCLDGEERQTLLGFMSRLVESNADVGRPSANKAAPRKAVARRRAPASPAGPEPELAAGQAERLGKPA